MSDWIVSLTGAWGPPLLAWYQANPWVNLLLVAYGAVVMLAWRNYDRVQQHAIDALLAGAAPDADGVWQLPASVSVDWLQAVRGLRFPWVARRGHLRLQPLAAADAETLLDWRQTRIIAERKLERMQKDQAK